MLYKTRSEDTIIFLAITPGITDIDKVSECLEEFFDKKKSIDHNDRFNLIIFTESGPKYLEDFTLYPEHVINALNKLKPEMVRANLAGGIFLAATFTAETFKKIPGKVYRLIILSDEGSICIKEEHLFFIEDLLKKVKNIPFIMDVVRINTEAQPKEDLILMKLARQTGGNIYEIPEVISKKREILRAMRLEKEHESSSVLSKLSEKTLRIASFLIGDSVDLIKKKHKEPEKIKDLISVLDILAEKKEIPIEVLDDDDKMDIPDESILFFESLADKPIPVKNENREKCSICFTSVRKNQEQLQCPYCKSLVHKICLAIWAKTSYISKKTPYIFRCQQCFTLLRLDRDFINLVHSVKTPIIEILDLDDIILEEYLESLESKKGPNIIGTEDSFFVESEDEEIEEEIITDLLEIEEDTNSNSFEYEEISEEDLQMIWCPHCNAMITNEYARCPRCNKPLSYEDRKLKPRVSLADKRLKEKAKIQRQISDLQVQANSDYKMGNYEEAILKAETIIKLAEKLGDKKIIEQQKEFIQKNKTLAVERAQINNIKRKLIYLQEKVDKLFNEKRYDEARKVIEHFKEKYSEILNNTTIPVVEKYLKEIEKKFEKHSIEQKDKLKIEFSEEVSVEKSKEKSIIEEPTFEEDSLLQLKDEIERIESAIKMCNELVNKNDFERAIKLIDATVKEIKSEELLSYRNKLIEKKNQIIENKKKYDTILEKINILEEKYREKNRNGKLRAAEIYAIKIIELADLINEFSLKEKYLRIKEEIRSKLDEFEKELGQEKDLSSKNLEELGEIISIENGIIPTLEYLNFKDIKEIVKEDSEQIINLIASIIEQKRNELKDNIYVSIFAKSEIQDAEELQFDIPIKANRVVKKVDKEKFTEIVEYYSELLFKNPFNSKAELIDIKAIVPYNYQISNILVENNDKKINPKESTIKDGLLIQLSFKNIPVNNEIKIRFALKKRISRTIIIAEKSRFKIIKTSYNISPLEKLGYYKNTIPLKIKIQNGPIKWLVIEDIIPNEFIPLLLGEENLLFADTALSPQGKLVGFIFENLNNKSIIINYKLFDSFIFEKFSIKLKAHNEKLENLLDKKDLIKIIREIKDFSKNLEKMFD